MMESLKKFWVETMEIDAARWVIWSTLLLILIIVAIYTVKFFRDQAFGAEGGGDGSLLDEIRRWKQSGIVDDDEFAQVQEIAAQRVRQELVGNRGTGVGAGVASGIDTNQPKPRPKTLAEMNALKQAAAAENSPGNQAANGNESLSSDEFSTQQTAVGDQASQVSNDEKSLSTDTEDVDFQEDKS